MKRTLTSLAGYALHATDGLVGHVDGFYFHDQDWRVGYVVVDLDHWFDQDRVLIPVQSIREIVDDTQELKLDLSRDEVKEAPAHDSKMPVSRQYYDDLVKFHRHGFYWEHVGDPHLYADYHLYGSIVRAGHQTAGMHGVGWLESMLVEPGEWHITDLAVVLSRVPDHRGVYVPTAKVKNLGWHHKHIDVDLDTEELIACEHYSFPGIGEGVTADRPELYANRWSQPWL